MAQTAAAMAVPLAQGAAAKAGPLAQSAAALAVPLAQGAVAKAGPLAQAAAAMAVPLATKAVTVISPLARSARGAVSPYAHSVAHRVGPYADRATGRLAPLAATAHGAVDRVGPVVTDAYGRVVPAVIDAYGRVVPAWELGRERVSEAVVPRVTGAVGAVTTSPVAVEAVRRSRATVAAARGELSLPEPPRSRNYTWVTRAAVGAAIAGVVAVLAKRALGGSKESGWQAARPSAPYRPPTQAPATGDEAGGDSGAADTADDTGSRYGEGAYVGNEPPDGYVIKGNENSGKYHVPDGSGYHSTKAEVWFNSEEAAKLAGFVRAQE